MNTASRAMTADALSFSESGASYSTRYFAVTYFAGDQPLHDSPHRTFRAGKMQRARRIALSCMPLHADRMELVEINGHEFQQHRARRKAALADRTQRVGFVEISVGSGE